MRRRGRKEASDEGPNRKPHGRRTPNVTTLLDYSRLAGVPINDLIDDAVGMFDVRAKTITLPPSDAVVTLASIAAGIGQLNKALLDVIESLSETQK